MGQPHGTGRGAAAPSPISPPPPHFVLVPVGGEQGCAPHWGGSWGLGVDLPPASCSLRHRSSSSRSRRCSSRSTSSGTVTSSRFSIPGPGSSPISTFSREGGVTGQWDVPPTTTPRSPFPPRGPGGHPRGILLPTWMRFSQAAKTWGSRSQLCSSRSTRYVPFSRTTCRPGLVAVSCDRQKEAAWAGGGGQKVTPQTA
ncbi:hypothetical protein llap_22966 [Limosa lapponica baueri]|uniref:Uncharacterized protein n=1 Tax=Limosa lapponica baueri TaxID=1758121 RepID=A0A2I0SYV1_LIMLA|nr:hypothetical protein llap_22966 [Limosa lapponica baueri]